MAARVSKRATVSTIDAIRDRFRLGFDGLRAGWSGRRFAMYLPMRRI